jgi:hypothetical protein
MKKLIINTIAIAALSCSAAFAELTPDQFGQVRNWANREGYVYRGVDIVSDVKVFVFESDKGFACAPVSSDTPDEAINALIGSAALYRMAVVAVREAVSQEREEAYRKGAVNLKELTEQAYRKGYIDGSQLRVGNGVL